MSEHCLRIPSQGGKNQKKVVLKQSSTTVIKVITQALNPQPLKKPSPLLQFRRGYRG